nr:reverse transcriptase domain-containing protein [Tanacetum cinerariifolium]
KDDEQSGRTVTLTTEDMQRKKNDVKARTTLLLSLLDEHQLSGNEDGNIACVSTSSTTFPTTSANVATISQDTASAYIASQSNAEEKTPKALMAIDEVGWDWSYMANEGEDHALVTDAEAPTEFTLMVNTESKAELLRAATEGYAEAIVVPPILAQQFEFKHSLINIMNSDQFFGLEKDNPHDHIRWGSPPVHNSGNKSVVSQVKSSDANSNSSSEIGKLTHAVNQQTSDVTTAMTAILKQFQATLPPASVKAIEKICVTCGGAHPYYQCHAAGGNTFPELRDNIQGYVAAAAVNYNQGNFVYRPSAITTRSGIVLDGPSILIPPPFINLEEDERVEETLMDQNLTEYTIKVPPPIV